MRRSTLVIIFPDERTTLLPPSDNELIKDPAVKTYHDISIKLIERYKREGYQITALVYADTDKNHFSYIYPPEMFSEIIRSKLTYNRWKRKDYQDELLSLIPSCFEKSNLVAGGYHADDCVAIFVAAAREYGLSAKVDLKLTDKFTFLLISHEARKMLTGNMLGDHRVDDTHIWKSFYESIEDTINTNRRNFSF